MQVIQTYLKYYFTFLGSHLGLCPSAAPLTLEWQERTCAVDAFQFFFLKLIKHCFNCTLSVKAIFFLHYLNNIKEPLTLLLFLSGTSHTGPKWKMEVFIFLMQSLSSQLATLQNQNPHVWKGVVNIQLIQTIFKRLSRLIQRLFKKSPEKQNCHFITLTPFSSFPHIWILDFFSFVVYLLILKA